MGVFFSPQMANFPVTTDGSAGENWDQNFRANPSTQGGTMKVASAEWTNGTDVTTVGASDQVYVNMFSLLGGDYIYDMYAYGNSASVDMKWDIGWSVWTPSNGSVSGVHPFAHAGWFAESLAIGMTASTRISMIEERADGDRDGVADPGDYGRSRGIKLKDYVNPSGTSYPSLTDQTPIVITARSNGSSPALDDLNVKIGLYAYYTSGQ